MAHVARPRSGNVELWEGEVVGVSSDGFTAMVKTRDGKRLPAQLGSPIATLGTITDEGLFGAGFKAGPVDGSEVLVATSSLGQHYILAFIQPRATAGYQGNREPIKPGDICINTRAGSFMDVLSSGVAQIGASDISKTSYLPEDESIRNICQNFLVATGLGTMSWSFDDATKKGSYSVLSRSGSNEDDPAGSMSLGDSPSGNLVELKTTNGGEASIAIDSKGNIRQDSEKDITHRSSQVIRQDARKIYLNSGASRGKLKFAGNFHALSPGTLLPGVPSAIPGLPSAIAKFPALGVLRTALPIPDPKQLLNRVRSVIPSNPLPRAPFGPPGGSPGRPV